MPDRPALAFEMDGVRGGDDGFPVQLCREHDTGRLVIRAVNEGGYACADIDLIDLIGWLHRLAPEGVDVDKILRALGPGKYPDRRAAVD